MGNRWVQKTGGVGIVAVVGLGILACSSKTPLRKINDGAVDGANAGVKDADGLANAVDLPPPRFACSDLSALTQVLTPQFCTRALFTKDRSLVVLRVRAPTEAGTGDDVLLVRLPSGTVTTLLHGIWAMEWQVEGEALLLETTDHSLLQMTIDGGQMRTLATGTCDHTLSPDGQRLFVFTDCNSMLHKLDVIDMSTGTTTRISDTAMDLGATRNPAVFSPDSTLAAFIAAEMADAESPAGVVHVLDRAGRDYAITSQPGATAPAFVSNDLLVFRTKHPSLRRVELLRGHVPGSGNQSYLVASDFDYDAFYGYHFARDGRHVLGARVHAAGYRQPAELAAIALDGSGTRTLASDLFAYWDISMWVDAFGLAGVHEHVVYITQPPDAGRGFRLMTVPLAGGTPRALGTGLDYASSPVSDDLAVSDHDSSDGGLLVLDLATGQEICRVKGGSVRELAFLPDGRGLVFVEYATTGARWLRYVSLPGCVPADLAQLDVAQVADAGVPSQAGFGLVDPTSCFTVVQSNTPQQPGARLVLLPP